ncbi:glutamate decarboxylase [Alicyclobacillus sp.]|uniref:glutamate decarboxylase n=1 Tax=Alicyclobacillus sp. TaxID=61169 RepID=UPI0025BD6EC1|nr:glutamate decarboxylase [Alicyclobacillus sp.]MCL6518014.1 glutamate decarboxylase [Alicyclobacillus sp.]
MWTVIYIAQSDKQAEQIQRRLADEGFLVKVRKTNLSRQQYEILIPESELDEVQEVLNEVLHSSYE